MARELGVDTAERREGAEVQQLAIAQREPWTAVDTAEDRLDHPFRESGGEAVERVAVSTRDRIIAATRLLLWERGYGATSPRAVMAASGTGQGSLCHHFPNKSALGAASIEATVADALADLADPDVEPLERVRTFLRRERATLRGCPARGRLRGSNRRGP